MPSCLSCTQLRAKHIVGINNFFINGLTKNQANCHKPLVYPELVLTIMNCESALLMLCRIHQSRFSPGPFGRECIPGSPNREEFVSKGFPQLVENIFQDL